MKMKLFSVLVVLLVAGGGYAYWHGKGTPVPQGAAAANAGGDAVVQVTRGSLQDIITAQGTLEPKEYVDVGAQVSGQIKKLHVDIGSVVKAGDLIAEIDPKTYETRVAGDEAQLKTLSAQKAEQQAQVKLAEQKLVRSRQLFADSAISREVLEESETDSEVAKAKLKSIQAQLEQALSTLEGDRVNLGYTRIYAPMDGTVVDRKIKEGQTINASQTAPVIVQVADLSVMTVRAEVAEADVMRIKTGLPVYFTTLGSQGRKWEGAVRQILPTPETVNDVVLYNVLIDVDNADGQLMTGMTTQNFFVVATAQNALLLPVSALGRRLPEKDAEGNGAAYEVTLVNGGATAQAVVYVGLMDRKSAEVKAGLGEADTVLVGAASAPAGGAQGTKARMPSMGPRL